MDTTQQQMNYMRGVNGQTSFHPNAPFIGGSSDLANLSSDLQQSSYEFDKQVNDDLKKTFTRLRILTISNLNSSHGQQSGHIKQIRTFHLFVASIVVATTF